MICPDCKRPMMTKDGVFVVHNADPILSLKPENYCPGVGKPASGAQFLRFLADATGTVLGESEHFLFHAGDEFTFQGPYHGVRGNSLFYVGTPVGRVQVSLFDEEYKIVFGSAQAGLPEETK